MTQIASGWYDDPKGSGQLRYWDGIAWTEHLRPPAAPPVMPAPTMPPPYGMPAHDPYGTVTPGRPDPYQRPVAFTSNGAGMNVTTQGSPRVFGIALIVFGILFTLSSLATMLPGLFMSAAFDDWSSAGPGAVETTGRVIDLRSEGADCTPLAEFTVDGETYQAIGQITYSPCNTAIGREVTVSYLPGDVGGSAIIADDSSFTDMFSGAFIGGGVIFTLVGVGMIVGGIALFRRGRK